MQIKLFVSAAAIALVAGLGSASAAEPFNTLEGITAAALTPQEMGVVKGNNSDVILTIANGSSFSPHVFHFPVAAGANVVIDDLNKRGVEIASGSGTAVYSGGL